MSLSWKHLVFAAFVAASAPAVSSVAQATELSSPESRQQFYIEFLKSKGIVAQVDSDGDVAFSRSFMGTEVSYFLRVNPSDPAFFELALANFWPIESVEERAKALALANKITGERKVAKVYIASNDNMWGTIEMFLQEPSDFSGVFDRSLAALEASVGAFVSGMQQ